jgi:DNA-binding SARP family transcriptional activator
MSGRRASRALALLVFLRVKERGRAVGRASLAGQLWQEQESDARPITRNAVSDLREFLGAEFGTSGPLAVGADTMSCDLDDLLHAIDATAGSTVEGAATGDPPGDTEPVDRVLSLYQGQFLDGWTRHALHPPRAAAPGVVHYADPFVDWIEAQREAVRTRVREHLGASAQAAADRCEWERALQILTTLRTRAPDARVADPHLWILELQAAYAAGDRTHGEAVHAEFRRVESDVPEVVRDAVRALRQTATPAGDTPVLPPAPSAPTSPGTRNRVRKRWVTVAGLVLLLITTWAVARSGVAGRATGDEANGVRTCTSATAKATLVGHNYQLGAVLKPGQAFTKGWWLLNEGGCVLGPGLRLHFVRDSGGALSAPAAGAPRADVRVERQARPGEEVLVDVPMRAPHTEGAVLEQWVLRDRNDRAIVVNGSPDALLARIRVIAHAPTCEPGKESAYFVAASHVPNQAMMAGQPFVGTFTLRNDGACVWPAGVTLARLSAATLGSTADSVRTDRPVEVGRLLTFRLEMRAPEVPGHYAETWGLANGMRSVPIGGERSIAMRIASVPAGEMASQTQIPACRLGETRAGFLGESPEDFVEYMPGAQFRKTWTLSNTSRCRWDKLYIRFRSASAVRMSSVDEVGRSNAVYPAAAYSFDVQLRAPRTPGVYTETWNVQDAWGSPVLVSGTDTIWVTIRVANPLRANPQRGEHR